MPRLNFRMPSGQRSHVQSRCEIAAPPRLFIPCFLLALVGCAPYRARVDFQPPVELPDRYTQSGAADAVAATSPDRWWERLGDQGLDALVSRALDGGNLQLRAGWARLSQAQAQLSQSGAARWPRLQISADASRGERFFAQNIIDTESYSLSAPVSYELDLFDKYGQAVDAAALGAQAARHDVEGIALSLAAEVTEAWLDLVMVEARRQLLESQRESNRTYLELVDLRFQQGMSAALDVYQQRQQLLATDAQIQALELQRVQASGRLALLLGVSMAGLELSLPAALPQPGPAPVVGVPADLLRRRPDLKSGLERLRAQDHQIAAAVSRRLPSLTLSGALSFSAGEPSALLDNLLTSIGASLAGVLFDGGAQRAEVLRNKAMLEEMVANYGQQWLQAILEVENALALEREHREAMDIQRLQLETAQKALREAQARYIEGLTDYIPVLVSMSSVHASQQALLTSDRQLLSHRVQLCRALGGHWAATLQRPAALEDSP